MTVDREGPDAGVGRWGQPAHRRKWAASPNPYSDAPCLALHAISALLLRGPGWLGDGARGAELDILLAMHGPSACCQPGDSSAVRHTGRVGSDCFPWLVRLARAVSVAASFRVVAGPGPYVVIFSDRAHQQNPPRR